MKSYTDLEQSKKLAEILPLESADMWWNFYSVTTDDTTPQIIHLDTPWVGNFNWDNKPDNVSCWSLAALLNVLPDTITSNDGIAFKLNIKKNIIEYSNPPLYLIYKSVKSDNIVDACYEMIEKLHKQKLL